MAPVGEKSEKAYLRIREASKDGGKGEIGRLEFQFNPKEFSIDKTADWNSKPSKPAKKGSKSEFTGASPRSMSVEVFLDTTDRPGHDITHDIRLLFEVCEPTLKSLEQNKPSPPFVTFGWGGTMQFEAIVESVSIKFTRFSPQGTPLRASATLKMKELAKEFASQNPTSGALTSLRTHTVVEGDSLASIAYKEYGDAALWRAVAESNGIDDPLRVVAGTNLLLPDIEEAGAFSSQ